ncbi:MAG: type IV secretory system conjugative DNA transfer family protein [Dokdonella sp.]
MSYTDAVAMKPRFSNDRSRSKGAQVDARLAIVRDAALGVGVQGGYAERAREIHGRIQQRSEQLDRIWNFTPLVDNGRLLAPAVQYTHHEQVLDAAALRETGKVLRVVEPARLVTMPPTWRDWLTIATVEVAHPDDTSLPQDDAERDMWKAALADAWKVGRAQADAVFQTEIESLTNAYVDRLRYKELVAQHMIGPAKLGQTNLGIVREDDVVRIEDSIYSVGAAAHFTAPKDWRPVVRPTSPTVDAEQGKGAGR